MRLTRACMRNEMRVHRDDEEEARWADFLADQGKRVYMCGDMHVHNIALE